MQDAKCKMQNNFPILRLSLMQ